MLVSRLGACYAVTPGHVVGGEIFATLKGGSGGKALGDADLLQKFGYDLAILRVRGRLAASCGDSLRSIPDLGDVLGAETSAAVSSVNPDGSVSRRPVTITDVGLVHLRVRPASDADRLFQGLSGSPVLVGDRPVGLLMAVDAATGEGRVLRYDRALETLRPFFGQGGGSGVGGGEGTSEAPPRAGAGSRDLVVRAWSSPPLGAEHRAENVTRQAGVWYAQARDFPVDLELAFPSDAVRTLHGVRIISEGVEPPERRVRDFEVFVSGSNDGGWMSVRSGTAFQTDDGKTLRFAPVRAKRILLRVHSHWGAEDAVGLGGVEVLEP